MRIIVSIQAKRESSRGLVHYIAHSKTDSAKEQKTRELFTEYSDRVSVEAANDFLKTGVEKKRSDNSQLHHIVISLKSDDFEKLGIDEAERQHSLKLVTRNVLEKLAESIGAEKLSWTAGIHRNTENPHVHIAIQKEYFDKNLEKKLLSKLPASLLPQYQNSGETRVFVPGKLIDAAETKLEEIIKSKQNERDHSLQTIQAAFNQNNPSESDRKDQKDQKEREILAQAILAKYHLEKSRDNLDSLENHGDKRRFKINDAISGQTRSMSLFDLERRAEKNANQNQKLKNIRDPKKRDDEIARLVAVEMSQNLDGIKRIKTILHNLIIKEHRNLKALEATYNELKPHAEKIRLQYRREKAKLPIPNLTPDEIETLQTQSIEKGDVRTSEYFERVRHAVSVELGIPTRSVEEIAKLKASQVISGLKVLSHEKQIAEFWNRKRSTQFEIDGKKWSLAKLDAIAQEKAKSNKTIVGKVSDLFSKVGLMKSGNETEKLEEIRNQILIKLDEKFEEMSTGGKREKAIQKMLNGFAEKDTNPEKGTIKPSFTAFDLAETERLSFDLRLTEIYRDNFEEQKALVANFSGTQTTDKTASRINKIISGRAVARELLCEIELARSKEALAKFKQFKIFHKFEIKNPKAETPQFVSLKEVEFDSSGSIFDQTLEYFIENLDKRQARKEIEKLVELKETELKADVVVAKNMLNAAAEETMNYKSRTIFGSLKYHVEPIFTPQELLTLELRIAETENRREATKLQNILEVFDYSKAKNLAAILEDISVEQIFAKTAKEFAGELKDLSERVTETKEFGVKNKVDFEKDR